MGRYLSVGLLFSTLALMPTTVLAQQPSPLGGYRVSSWMEEDGLPPGAIWALAQDQEGFLWIGCDTGLVRFDGVRFRTWQELGGADLPSGPVHALIVARDGSMWAGFTDQPQIARLQGRSIALFGAKDGVRSATTSLAEDRDGTIWAGTSDGLLRFSRDTFVTAAVGGRTGNIIALTVGSTGHLFVATENTVYERRPAASTFTPRASTSTVVQGFTVDTQDRVWITDRTLGYRSIPQEAGAGYHPGPRGKGYRLITDSKGNLWLATYGQGIWQVRLSEPGTGKQVQSLTDSQGLSNNVIYSLLEDRSGNIWVGTTAGLNRLAPQRLSQIQDLGIVTGVEATGPETVWANTVDGLTRFRHSRGQWVRDEQSNQRLHTDVMEADVDGGLWVASPAGVERITGGVGRIRRERVSGALRHVRSITAAPDHSVWVFDIERGLHRWQRGTLTRVGAPFAAGRRVSSIFADGSGHLWVAETGQGSLMRVSEDGSVREFGSREGYSSGYPRVLFEDHEGTLWVAGSLGLSRFANGRFVSIKRDAHLPIDGLTSIIEDTNGRLWLGTASGILGLAKTDFEAALAHRWDDIAAITLDSADGVAGTTGWIGQPSAVRTADGRLWFLTSTGITTLDPKVIQDTTPPLPVRVEAISIDDRHLAVSTPLHIPSTASRLQIEFAIPTLSPAQRTRFRYRLDGYDTQWINSGRLRTAIYTNLPPRRYRFQVQLQDATGSWPNRAASWEFTVEPAFYQTAWFLALCGVVIVGVAWSAWRLRVAQVRRQLAVVHGERARLSREIHDTLLQSLVGVALQCDALAAAPDREGLTKGLLTLRRQVEGYVRECRQSVWNLRSPMLETKDLATALQQVAARATNAAGIALQMSVRGPSRRSPGRIDEQLLRIGQEAVTNAARHSGATIVHIGLTYEPAEIMLRIRDNGRGFHPGDPAHSGFGHWGLVGMQERAKATRGTLTIVSEPGHGTDIVVRVPLPEIPGTDGETEDHRAVHGRSSDRSGRHRTDHQPAA